MIMYPGPGVLSSVENLLFVENFVETVKTMIFYFYFTFGNQLSTLSTTCLWKYVDVFSDNSLSFFLAVNSTK